MTTYTQAMLAEEALANLFRDGGAGQSPQAEDVEFVTDRIEAMLADLEARSVVTVPDSDDIDPAIFTALGEILADVCAPKFNKARNPALRLDAEERIKTVVNNAPATRSTLDVDPMLKPGRAFLTLARWTRGY